LQQIDKAYTTTDMAHLPLEVILVVLDRFKDSEEFTNKTKRQVGRSITLVCRALREVGSSMVWSDVKQELGTNENELISLFERERIAPFVKTLVINSSHRKETKLAWEEFRRLLPRLDNLQHAEFKNLPATIFDLFFSTSLASISCGFGIYCETGHPIPLEQIRNPFGQNLRSFKLQQASPHWTRPKELLDLVNKIRTLRSLDLDIALPSVYNLSGRTLDQEEEDINAISSLDLVPLPLESLTLVLFRGSSRFNEAILDIVLHRLVEREKLTSLRIENGMNSVDESWLPIFPSLHTFYLKLPYASFHNHLPSISRALPQQTHLRILFLRVNGQETSTAPTKVLRGFLNSLPPLLETIELAITFLGGAHSEPLNSFLHDRRAMPLKEMSVAVRLEEDERMDSKRVSWIKKKQENNGQVRWAVSVSPEHRLPLESLVDRPES
jgi:hypothetical protein